MFSAYNPQVRHDNTYLVSAAFERLIQAAKLLLRDIACGMNDSLHYDDVKELLGTVPLTTGEHAWAVNRLGNAMEYAAEGEIGGASYELTLLVRNLAKRRQMSEM